MLEKHNLDVLLRVIARVSNSAARKYGVHRYEHGSHYRPSPEPFVVNAVYTYLVGLGYEITAEANQGGIWKLAKRSRNMPRDSSQRRYDLVIWRGGKKPIALCEFKWGFNPKGFQADAAALDKAREALNISPVLCLMTVKEDKSKLQPAIDKQIEYLNTKYGIRSLEASGIARAHQYFCGRPVKDQYVHMRTIACSTK